MPFYEYRRPDGTIFEIMQKMSDPPLTADPETGVPVQRVFRPIAVHFKGKGFYNTDYGPGSRSRDKDGEGAEPAKSESPVEQKIKESKAVQKLEAAKAESGRGSSSKAKSTKD